MEDMQPDSVSVSGIGWTHCSKDSVKPTNKGIVWSMGLWGNSCGPCELTISLPDVDFEAFLNGWLQLRLGLCGFQQL